MITKLEALAKMTQEEEAEFLLWEKKIDNALASFSGHTAIDSRGLSYRVRNRLIQHYKKGGWAVTHTDDQRDGPFLSFT